MNKYMVRATACMEMLAFAACAQFRLEGGLYGQRGVKFQKKVCET